MIQTISTGTTITSSIAKEAHQADYTHINESQETQKENSQTAPFNQRIRAKTSPAGTFSPHIGVDKLPHHSSQYSQRNIPKHKRAL